MTSSVIVHRGPSPVDGAPIVGVLTGLERPSSNRKTGPMLQLWILRADMHPVEALRTGADAAVCDSCPLRPQERPDGTRGDRACYVTPNPLGAIYRSLPNVPDVSADEAAGLVAGRALRLGAYGEPTMLPLDTVHAMTDAARMHTGYTHRWSTVDPEWSGLIMASADNPAERRAARAKSWRSFYLLPDGSEPDPGTVECPAARTGNRRRCIDCGACAGTRGGTSHGADIWIRPHGNGAKYVREEG